jgi:phospholipid/cholesterol/gamma-HCH transport system substrate-binding protein
MLKYQGRRLIRAGFIGLVLIALVIAIGLQPERLWSLATQVTYRALFAEAGGLAAGNEVKLSGVDVGTVTEVALQGLQPLVTFKVDATVRLASDTSAHIRTGSLLGERVLVLESAGGAKLRPFDVIPASRRPDQKHRCD